ncbi:MAG: aminopeptidase P family protein [Spirochaetaceae bacterium]|jgi:Xaa-Pro aminopeptidase|nr:aminopeptidase P family protein [Spirochaetaceae bacterium]
MNSEVITKIQKVIREEGLDGWLFCNFRHRDKLSDELLERPAGLSNSRLWFYTIPASGEPEGLVHAIEADHLDGLPGTRKTYISRENLLHRLKPLGGKRWGVHASENISSLSYMDAGTYGMLAGAGLHLCSAERLIQRFKGLLDEEGIASHERAAEELYRIVKKVWDLVSSAYSQNRKLYEGDLRQRMEDEFLRLGLVRDHPPLAAAGRHSANPHYDFEGPGALIKKGDLIQLDLWAKEKAGIYADISWAGFYGKKAEPEMNRLFGDLAEAREETLRFIETALEGGKELSGAEVDRTCRSLLRARGHGAGLKHRTGHGIDTECHGCGVNLDSLEFTDPRPLLEGSCFSVEPGIYRARYGFRTEVNVVIRGGKPWVSGPGNTKQGRQFGLLHC